MKLFSSLLLSLSTLAFCLPGQAQTSNEEDLLVATEVPRIVVNYAPNGVIAGRAILYNCDTCEPEQVEFTADRQAGLACFAMKPGGGADGRRQAGTPVQGLGQV